ncbi:MAG: efflux RND transporter periplasmic adaptor subunit [Acidobacteria bacterium]|nr:efflux RND transporter periplasmic adaptor subunit [Acidobacteriota bacterium]
MLVIGLGIGYLVRSPKPDLAAGRPIPRVSAPPVTASEPADLTISPDVVERAGLKIAPLESRSDNSTLRTSGVVQPNSYRETPIMPLVEGRVTRVMVQLGDRVSEGQTLATIFSAELAEAQMKYLTVDANLQFHIGQAARFEKLAQIGAVSRQELEEVLSRLREHHAEHASLRERMLLYGLTEQEIASLKESGQLRSDVPVHAPASGVITNREINVGQNLAMRDRLFTITDLSTIWVIANVYEKDFQLLQPGRTVTITTTAWPGRQWSGRVSYIDPRVDEESRTARARIEVANPDQRLRLGMFVDVALQAGGQTDRNISMLSVPKAAIQSLGDQQVVFVPVGAGRFQVRRILTGRVDAGWVEVISGISPGEQVVTEGSFFLMAELGRKGS